MIQHPSRQLTSHRGQPGTRLAQMERRIRRDAALNVRFTELYHGRRLRIDDVYGQLGEEFFLAPATVERILQNQGARQRVEQCYL